MKLAELAQLVAVLKLRDQMSRPLGAATAAVGKADAGVGRLQSRVNGLSGAMGKARGTFGSFISSNLGLIGLTVGIGGAVAALKGAITTSQDFAAASQDLARVTDQSIGNASQLVDVLEKFGVEGDAAIKTFGMLQRNAQTLAGTTKAATKFQKAYGFSLLDSSGKIADANELLLRSAEYFNSNATASEKATVLQKLYGRSWQALIPLLSQGRAGLEKQFATALKLTPKQIKDMVALRGAQREFNDTLGDTQVLVGLALTPALTRAARALNSLLGRHQQDLVGLTEGLAQFAGEVGSVFKDVVLPSVQAIAGAWNAIPPEVRKLLLVGFVGNKVLKMTIGFDPIDLARKGITDAISGGLKQVFGRGSPANPMYTREVGLGGATGGAAAGAAGAAGRGGGLAGRVLGALGILGSAIAVVATQQEVSGNNSQQALDLQSQAVDWLKRSPSRSDLVDGLGAVDRGIAEIRSNPLNVLVQGDALNRLEAIRAQILGQIAATNALGPKIDRIQAGVTIQQFLQGAGATFAKSVSGSKTNANVRNGSRPAPRGRIRNSDGTWRTVGTSVNVNVATDHRQNSQAASTQLRYGPTPATAGAR